MRQINKTYLKNIGTVKCLICGDNLKYISNTHLKKHNITNKKYQEMFPYTPTMSRETLELMSNNGKKRRDDFMKIQNPSPNIEKARKASNQTASIRRKMGLCNRTEGSIVKQVNTLKQKVKEGKWVNPSSTQEAKEKLHNSAKKRYKEGINLKVDKHSGRFVKLNNGNDGIPPKPKDLGILPTII